MFKEAYDLIFLKDISQFKRLQQVFNSLFFSFDITSNHQSSLENCLRLQVFRMFLWFISIQYIRWILTKRTQLELYSTPLFLLTI